MSVCSVCGSTTKSSKTSEVSFHRIPRDESRRAQWITILEREINWTPSRGNRVCSKHFPEEMFDRSLKKAVRLRKDAVPSIFNNSLPYVKHESQESSSPTEGLDVTTLQIQNVRGSSPFPFVFPKVETDDSQLNTIVSSSEDWDRKSIMESSFNVVKTECDTTATLSNEKDALKRKNEELEEALAKERKRVKILQKTVRQLENKISGLPVLLEELENRGLIHSDALYVLNQHLA